jgi:gliding motility-associated protein GldE
LDPDPSSSTIGVADAVGFAFDPAIVAVEIGVLLLLLASSALFSGSEVALFSIKASTRVALAAGKDRAGRRVARLLEKPREVLVTILILNTFANVMAAIIAAVVTAQAASTFQWSTTLTVAIEVVVLTFVILVVSEITPKLLATRNPQIFAKRVGGLLFVLHRLLRPVSRSLAGMTAGIHSGLTPSARRISGEDVKTMAEIGEAHGTIEHEERELIHSIVEFGETSVREIMVSRLDIQAIPVTATLQEALEIVRSSGHSRLPLYVDHLDNILGVVHAKDLLPYLSDTDEAVRIDLTRIARRPVFVPPGKKLDDLLREFQSRKTHIAIVVDEYGGTAGLVTLEDVLEEIVGDIRDEHDEDEETYAERLDDWSYRCDARLNLDDLGELLGVELAAEEFDFETLGGLIFHLSGSVPSAGDVLEYEGIRLTVESVETNRIGEVLVRQLPEAAVPRDDA